MHDGPERDAAIRELARRGLTAGDADTFLATVSVGQVADVRLFLQAGASPDARNARGEPALLVAVAGGRQEVARLLIEAGANADAADPEGRTPLDCAFERRDRHLAAVIAQASKAPVDELTRARRVIEGAWGVEGFSATASSKAALREGKTLLDAALRGEDLSAHVPALLRCVRERVRESLSRALVVHFLRRGDVEGIRRLGALDPAAGFQAPPGGFSSLAASAVDFADAGGVDVAPAYPLLARWPSSGGWALCRHLERHPERVETVLAAVAASPPDVLPDLARSLACNTSTWDAWPAEVSASIASFVAKLLRSNDEAARRAASRALAACAQFPALDLAGVAPELDAALAEEREPRAVGLALARHALSRQPADWSAAQHLLAHPRAEVREAAVQVLAWVWLRGRDEPEIVARIAAALLDAEPAVRKVAAETLLAGHGQRRPLGRLEAALLARLLTALDEPELADAVASFLEAYVMSDPTRAQDVLGVLAARPGTSVGPRQLADTCHALMAARDPASCPLCQRLGERPWWGEEFQEPTRPPPPELAHLTRLASRPQELFQCPHCGTYYQVKEGGGSYLNAEWTHYTLEPMARPAPGAAWAMTHAFVQRGDLAGLDRELLQGADPDRRLETLRVLAQRVEDGLEVAALEPTLRALLAEPETVAQAAAGVLARHWIRIGRWPDVLALSQRDEPHLCWGVVDAVWSAATRRWGDVRPFFSRARELLGSADGNVRAYARVTLEAGGGLRGEDGALTVAAATRLLDSSEPSVRDDAAFALAEAAKEGADIAGALPRFGPLLRDGAARWIVDAILRAAWHGTDVAPLLPELVARLRRGEDTDKIVGVLRALQEDGVDISSAFEALRAVATPGSWANFLLERGSEPQAQR